MGAVLFTDLISTGDILSVLRGFPHDNRACALLPARLPGVARTGVTEAAGSSPSYPTGKT